MFRKSVLKSVMCVTLVITILISCTFSVSARRSFYEVDSSEWISSNNNILREVYPNRIERYPFIDEVYQFDEFNGSSYVVSSSWYDYDYAIEYEFTFPSLPEGNEDLDYLVLSYADNVADYFSIYTFDSDMVHAIYNYDEETIFLRNMSSGHPNISCYLITYPYEEWDFLYGAILDKNSTEPIPSDFHYYWSSCPLYDYVSESDVYLSAGDNSFWSSSHIANIMTEELYVTSGALYFQIPADIIGDLAYKDTAFVFEDFGFITAANTSFIDFRYGMTFRLNGEYVSSGNFIKYKYLGFLKDEVYPPATHSIFDYVDSIDFSELNSSGVPLDIVVTFTFVSDGYSLFFPGSFSIPDYSEYVADQYHNEVIGSISDSTSQIIGSIDSMNDNLEYIISGDVGVPQPDFDTSELDTVVQEQDEIIGDILSSLDDNISDFVPAGYDSYTDYLIDNINSFKSTDFNNTFTFIRSTFDSLVASLSILPLMLFSLSFGFAVFAIGRRLR